MEIGEIAAERYASFHIQRNGRETACDGMSGKALARSLAWSGRRAGRLGYKYWPCQVVLFLTFCPPLTSLPSIWFSVSAGSSPVPAISNKPVIATSSLLSSSVARPIPHFDQHHQPTRTDMTIEPTVAPMPKEKVATQVYSEDVKHEYHEGPHHQPALERNFSFWSCLGLAFAILNSWNGEWQRNQTEMGRC